MATYKIHKIHDKFMSFFVSNDELYAKMGEDFTFHINSSPVPQKAHWNAPSVSFYTPDEYKTATAIPDITTWGHSKLVINEKVHSSINFEEVGEVLPVFCEGIPYYVINILTIVDDEAVDQKKSKKNLVEGHYMGIDTLAFIDEKVNDLLVFRTRFDGCVGLYCSERFKKMVEDNGCAGIRFSEDLTSVL